MANESSDREYAARLQREDDRVAMMTSDSGRAVLLVDEIISLVRLTNEACPTLKDYNIESVSYDDMVYFAERLLLQQREFSKHQRPTTVDVGYHYTNESNLPRIRSHGLLTKGDRAAKKVASSKDHGSTFGDGIYTSNNAEAFSVYGDTGLIVGRLQGKTLRVPTYLSSRTEVGDANTIIGDKNGRPFDSDSHYNEVVLRTSKQCLPMIRYSANLLSSVDAGIAFLSNVAASLEQILDKFFNDTRCGDDGKPFSADPSSLVLSRFGPPPSTRSAALSFGPSTSAAFSFGPSNSSTPTKIQTTPGGGTFGRKSTAQSSNTSTNPVFRSVPKTFGTTCMNHGGFSFGTMQEPKKRKPEIFSRKSATGGFSFGFGMPPAGNANEKASGFSFGTALPAGGFSFGTTSSSEKATFERNRASGGGFSLTAESAVKPTLSSTFSFGHSNASELVEAVSRGFSAVKICAVPGMTSPRAKLVYPSNERAAFSEKEEDIQSEKPTSAAAAPKIFRTTKLHYQENLMSNVAPKNAFSTKPLSHSTFGTMLKTEGNNPQLSCLPDYHKLLTEFYQKHNTQKVPEIAKILQKYKGSEADMFVKLAEKYNTSNALHGKAASLLVTFAQSNTEPPMFGVSAPCRSAAASSTLPPSFGTPKKSSSGAAIVAKPFGTSSKKEDTKATNKTSNAAAFPPEKPSSVFLPMSKNGESKSTAPSPFSNKSTAFPPMPATVPSPFGVLQKKAEGRIAEKPSSAAAFPPTSAKVPSSFGAFSKNDESKSAAPSPFANRSTSFPPMPTTVPSPFGVLQKKAEGKIAEKPSSAAASPPMPATVPPRFGAFSKDDEIKSAAPSPFVGTSTAFPPMPATMPSPFGVLTKKAEGKIAEKPFSVAFPPMPATLPSRFGAFSKNDESKRAAPSPFADRSTVLTNTTTGFSYYAPPALTDGIPPNSLTLPSLSNMSDDCVVCHEKFSDSPCVALIQCQHIFHRECITRAFQSKPQCPICRKPVGAPQGRQPSGSMYVTTIPFKCSGFQEDSIEIRYHIPSGIQMSYHDEPGHVHGGKYSICYMPNNDDGRDLLKRLIYAFMHGLTFTVGTSVTTRKKNQCTWASIHHKTSTGGGVRKHGYPDPEYFVNCHSEMNSLGVPPADALYNNGTERIYG